MDIRNPRSLLDGANRALARGREPKKLVYTYAGITLALSVVIALANLWLEEQISGTGGLGNLGTRAIFTTAQQAIPLLASLVSMCLDVGYLAGMMRISRGQYADHTDLRTGLRLFWPLLRMSLLQGMLFIAAGFLAVQVSSVIFTLTPWSAPLQALLASATVIDEAFLTEAAAVMGPMYLITAVVCLLMFLPIMFRLRMATFCLLDAPRAGAMAAMRASNRMMRRRFGTMLKIDLYLWPYYLAVLVMSVVLYADQFLLLAGVPLPVDAGILSLAVLALSAVLQFVIQITLRNRTEATYLLAYEQLREKPRDQGVVLGNIFDM